MFMYHTPLLVLYAASVHALNVQFNVQVDDGAQVTLSGPQVEGFSAWDKDVLSSGKDLPIVDLGYTKHQAVPNPFNQKIYHFRSIRYAAPPTGSLRFKAPQPPLPGKEGAVENGVDRKECPQAMIKWGDNLPDQSFDDPQCCEAELDMEGICHSPCSSRKLVDPPTNLLGGFRPPLTNRFRYSEDCLHLDVWAPKQVFEGENKVPVLVWIYGGAYIFGGKSLYSPGGLLNRTLLQEGGGMIFVSMNYRMGAFGFAAGEDIADEDVNAGLLDQQQALRWVQQHIHKFGGDPNMVTIAGLSAGGGSVIHHLTAYGGEQQENLFKRAISLSGSWQPVVNKTRAQATFRDFMKMNDVDTIEELRKVPEDKLIRANYDQIAKATPGNFLYNPVGWGKFSPGSASKLLRNGKFNNDKEVMVSHTVDEGGAFTKAFRKEGTTVAEFLDMALPDLNKDEREWIMRKYKRTEQDELKPSHQIIGDIIGDATFRCPVQYVTDAYRHHNRVFQHRWNVTNSHRHGGDLLYLFWQPYVPVASMRTATILQDYAVNFASYGFPFTGVQNPKNTEPEPEAYFWLQKDDRLQAIDSGMRGYPRVTRQKRDDPDLCRVWQTFGST